MNHNAARSQVARGIVTVSTRAILDLQSAPDIDGLRNSPLAESSGGISIGVDVFGRSAQYDPRLDPVVRVEAARLRTKLAQYYAGPGYDDRIVIDLPKGSYVPEFRRQASIGGLPSAPIGAAAAPDLHACTRPARRGTHRHLRSPHAREQLRGASISLATESHLYFCKNLMPTPTKASQRDHCLIDCW